MGRKLTLEQEKAIDNGNSYAWFVDADHPSGRLFGYTGPNYIEYQGIRYLGLLGIIETTGLGSSEEIALDEQSVTIVGETAKAQGVDFDAPVRNRIATISLGLFDENRNLIDGLIPFKNYTMQFSTTNFSDDGTFSYTITGTSSFFQVKSPTGLIWSQEYFDDRFPHLNSTGFTKVEAIERKRTWVEGASPRGV